LARSAGAAGDRLRHAVPAEPARARMAAEPRPRARRRRPHPGVLMPVQQFKLPDLGEGLTEGDILKWTVAVGDTVDVNDTIAEVETVKAAVELPSPFAGVVTALHAKEGETVPVGTPII